MDPVQDTDCTRSTLPLSEDIWLCVFDQVHSLFSPSATRNTPQITFNALSLVCTAFHSLVGRVRFNELVVLTAKSARSLVDNASDEVLDVIRQQTLRIIFGQKLEEVWDDGTEDEAFSEVLAVLGALNAVDELTVRGMSVTDKLFTPIKRRLKKLTLSECSLSLSESRFHLPALDSLNLSLTEHRSETTDWAHFFLSASLPKLTHLSLGDTDTPIFMNTPGYTKAVAVLAPQLTMLRLDEDQLWIARTEQTVWKSMTSLTELCIAEPRSPRQRNETETDSLVTNCLESLPPNSLKTLNISDAYTLPTTAERVRTALITGVPSLAKLEKLVLNKVCRDLADDVPETWTSSYDELQTEAKKRGITIEHEWPSFYDPAEDESS